MLCCIANLMLSTLLLKKKNEIALWTYYELIQKQREPISKSLLIAVQ